MPDELWDEAQAEAEAQGLSRSELVRRGLIREMAYARMKRMRAAVKEAGK